MKQPYQGYDQCDGRVSWVAPSKDDDVRSWEPICPTCGGVMEGPVSKSNCNVCGRELINEDEDSVGLCAACSY